MFSSEFCKISKNNFLRNTFGGCFCKEFLSACSQTSVINLFCENATFIQLFCNLYVKTSVADIWLDVKHKFNLVLELTQETKLEIFETEWHPAWKMQRILPCWSVFLITLQGSISIKTGRHENVYLVTLWILQISLRSHFSRHYVFKKVFSQYIKIDFLKNSVKMLMSP